MIHKKIEILHVELDYYLFRYDFKHKDFAKEIGVNPATLSLYVRRKTNPSLPTAIRIYEATDGKVSYKEMLREEDRLLE